MSQKKRLGWENKDEPEDKSKETTVNVNVQTPNTTVEKKVVKETDDKADDTPTPGTSS